MKWEVVDDGGSNKHLPDFANKPESGMLGSGLRHRAVVEDGEVIATVWNHHDASRCIEVANLMSAAQELLETLEALLPLGPAEGDGFMWEPIAERARAAIKKAKGQA